MHDAPVAVITGSAQRLGCAMAQAFHQQGYNLVLHYRNTPIQNLLNQFNEMRPDSAVAVRADLKDSSAPNIIADAAIQHFDKVNLLINNASSFFPTPIGSGTEAQWDDLFFSNARAPFFLSQALAPILKQNNGCIINMVDVYADRPKKNHTIYCMAKAANVMLTKSLAIELAPEVRVNGIAPGAALWAEGSEGKDKSKTLEKIPLKRIGGTASIVEAALYLAKDDSYMTGHILNVDGGKNVLVS